MDGWPGKPRVQEDAERKKLGVYPQTYVQRWTSYDWYDDVGLAKRVTTELYPNSSFYN